MNLKGCLTAVGLLLIVLLGVSFFLPKDMNTEVSKQLNASPEQVFAQVNNLKNWENWSPWKAMDPDMQITYGETYAGEGGSYTWTSEKKGMGNGALFIDESIPNEKLVTLVKFEGFDDSYGTFTIAPDGDGSNVSWDFSSDYSAKWPWQKVGMTIGRSMLKKQYEKGLSSIDAFVAENPDAHLAEGGGNKKIAIVEEEVEPFNAISVNRKGAIDDMEQNGEKIYGEAYGEVGEIIEKEGHTQAGMPFSQALSWDMVNGTYDFEIGIPVESGGREFGGGKVVKASYYGLYSGIGVAHEAIEVYCQKNNLEIRGAPWEIYANDPGDYPDPADWLTEVYYPVN